MVAKQNCRYQSRHPRKKSLMKNYTSVKIKERCNVMTNRNGENFHMPIPATSDLDWHHGISDWVSEMDTVSWLSNYMRPSSTLVTEEKSVVAVVHCNSFVSEILLSW